MWGRVVSDMVVPPPSRGKTGEAQMLKAQEDLAGARTLSRNWGWKLLSGNELHVK